MKVKKFTLTDETMCFNGKTLHRIKALKSFSSVKEGDLGGWVESEDNLSQNDNCWIADNAKVWSNARVTGNVHVCGFTNICGNVEVYGNCKLNFNKHFIIDGDIIIKPLNGNNIICDKSYYNECYTH